MIKYLILAQGSAAEPVKPQPIEVERLLLAAKDWITANGLTFARNLVVAILIFVIGRMIANAVHRLIVRLLENRKVDQTAIRFVANIASATIMVLVVITGLGQLGIPTAQFAALIAAAGLAIGLALQGNLSNFAAGFLIIFFHPFKKGDMIAGGGTEGIVEEVQVFTTIITTPDNKRIIVPNAKFTGDNITNFTANPSRRVDLTFVAGVQNDPQRVEQTLLAAAAAETKVLKAPSPAAVLKDINGRLIFELRAWCQTADFADVQASLNEKVYRRFAADQISGPIPLQVVRMQDK
jgi:small conductance mechanosensitive channel